MHLGSLVSILVIAAAVSAVTIGVRHDKSPRLIDLSSLKHHAPTLATRGVARLEENQQSSYTTTVRVGGKDLVVRIDSILGDLNPVSTLAAPDLLNDAVVHNDVFMNLTYEDRWVSGHVAQMNITFGGHEVNGQAVLLFDQTNSAERRSGTAPGLLGLGLTESSVIAKYVAKTNQTWARSLLDNIFASNAAAPRHVAFRLDRPKDSNNYTEVGAIDIGTFAPGFGAIENTVKVPVISSSWLPWSVLVDKVTLNGKAQTIVSMGKRIPNKKAVAFLDFSSTFAYLAPELLHTIYSTMGGVLLNDDTYVVPCTAEAQLVFNIGGHAIPIHPLDLTELAIITSNSTQSYTVCVNTFSSLPDWMRDDGPCFWLGGLFLRNVYSLFDYGSRRKSISGSTNNGPHVKLLPLTGATAASAEFKEVRAAQLNATDIPPQLQYQSSDIGNWMLKAELTRLKGQRG